MKNGKKPTRRQKKAIMAVKLVPDNWLVFKLEPSSIHIVHRISGNTKIIPL